MVCLSRPYPFKSFKGCLPQILLGPLLNTLSHDQTSKEARRNCFANLYLLLTFLETPKTVRKMSVKSLQNNYAG